MAQAELLERGDLYFLYTPRVQPAVDLPFDSETPVRGPRDVQRLHVILRPWDRGAYRRLLVGRKRMPETSRQRFWAEIERVGETPESVLGDLGRFEYETKTRGTRVQPPARAAGEGVYAVARHGDHAHLAYRLERPRKAGEVQRALRILPEASYIVAAFNPEAPPKLGRRRPEMGPLPAWMRESSKRSPTMSLRSSSSTPVTRFRRPKSRFASRSRFATKEAMAGSYRSRSLS